MLVLLGQIAASWLSLQLSFELPSVLGSLGPGRDTEITASIHTSIECMYEPCRPHDGYRVRFDGWRPDEMEEQVGRRRRLGDKPGRRRRVA